MEIQRQKDHNLVFQKHLSTFVQGPTENQSYIAKKNLDKLIDLVLKDCNEFHSNTVTKLKSYTQLKHLIVLVGDDIQLYVEKIIKHCAKNYFSDDGAFIAEIKVISQVIGILISSDIYVPIIIKLLSDEESKINLKQIQSYLDKILLSQLMINENDSTLGDNLQTIIHQLMQIENQYNENFDIISAMFDVVTQIILVSNQNLPVYARQLFGMVLTVQSFQNLPEKISVKYFQKYGKKVRINQALEHLAQVCGYASVSDLHSNEVYVLLDEIVLNKTYEHWKKGGRDINKFHVIVQGCGEGIAKFMNHVIQIMSHCIQPTQDVELRAEILMLLEQILRILRIAQTLRMYSTQILTKLIIPSMIWKVGKPQIKIRKGAIINAIVLLENQLITGDEISTIFKQIAPPLKSCLNDDWAPDLRWASTKLIQKIFNMSQLSEDDLRDFYPSLLERLDDSQDAIRIDMSNAIQILFKSEKCNLSRSIIEYMIKAILIHLDDQNEKVQREIFECLKCAAYLNPKYLMTEAEIQIKNFKYPRLCEELIKYSKEIIASQPSELLQE